MTQTLIIGGGLSGLALATTLEAGGHDYTILEARDRFGGRIKTLQYGSGYFDLGPAWFWPDQPRITGLINKLGLTRFDQYTEGFLTFENERGQVQSGEGHALMQGSWRLEGGLSALIDGLARQIPRHRLHLSATVTKVSKTPKGIIVTLSDGRQSTAQKIIFALPSRLAAKIAFDPVLPEATIFDMRRIATWMAGQSKAIAIYNTPFWREAGLSGDAMSMLGPMVEIHDASPKTGGPYALFGFIGVPPHARANKDLLAQQLLAQLRRLFGAQAANPLKLSIKDWAADPFTSTEADKHPLISHPAYGMPNSMVGLWDDTLLFAGSEVAHEFGGFIEGALEASENVLENLKR